MPSWIRRTAALSIAGWLSVGIVAGVAVESASLPMATVAWELESVPAGHPRILPGCGGLERLRANAATPDGKAFAGRILFDAAGLLEAPPVKYQPAADTGQLLWTSRNVLYRINTLGVSYLLSDDPRFARGASLMRNDLYAILFAFGDVLTNFVLIYCIYFIIKMERGYSTRIDAASMITSEEAAAN